MTPTFAILFTVLLAFFFGGFLFILYKISKKVITWNSEIDSKVIGIKEVAESTKESTEILRDAIKGIPEFMEAMKTESFNLRELMTEHQTTIFLMKDMMQSLIKRTDQNESEIKKANRRIVQIAKKVAIDETEFQDV
jgi:hypothetical protein